MKQKFIITKTLPGLNEIIAAASKPRFGHKVYARMKRECDEYIGWCIKEAKIKPIKRVKIDFTWVEKNKRRDPDNVCSAKKFILDALVQMGILENDGWKEIITMTDHFIVNEKESGVIVNLDDLCEICHPVDIASLKTILPNEDYE